MTRERILVLDRSGYHTFRHADGTPFFDPHASASPW